MGIRLNLSFLIIELFIILTHANNQQLVPISSNINQKFFILHNHIIVIVLNDGIHFYNSDLTIEDNSKKILFPQNICLFENEKILIKQFPKEDGGYLMILVLDKIYFFKPDGSIMNSIYIPDISNSDNYCLTPYKKKNNDLYYIIAYNKKQNFILKQFKFNINSFSNQIINSKIVDKIFQFYKSKIILTEQIKGLSCISMSHPKINSDFLTCFYFVYFPLKIKVKTFDINNNFEQLKNFSNYLNLIKFGNISYISTLTNEEKQKALIYFGNKNNNYLITFDYVNSFSKPKQIINNSSNKIKLFYHKIFYVRQTNEFFLIFTTSDKCKIYFIIFNDDLNLRKQSFFNLEKCYHNFSFFIFYNEAFHTIIYDNKNLMKLKIFNYEDINLFLNESNEIQIEFKEENLYSNYINNEHKSIYKVNKKRLLSDENYDHNIDNINNNDMNRNNDDFRNRDDNNRDNKDRNDNINPRDDRKDGKKNEDNNFNPFEDDRKNGKNNEDNNFNPFEDDRHKDKEPLGPFFDRNNSNFNITSFKLGECERILKRHYNLDDNISLIISMDNKEQMDRRGKMQEEYEPINNTKLDMRLCDNRRFNFDFNVRIDEKHLFKYDRFSEYYNDKCFTYTSEAGTDIILKDRRKEFIKNNMSLCERNCDFKGYDMNSKNAKCECEIKAENYEENSETDTTTEEEENFFSNFINITSITNIDVLKCYKNIFTKNGLLKNYGNYIMIFIILIYIISLIYFKIEGYSSFFKKINIILKIKANTNKKVYSKFIKTKNRIKKINFPPKKIKLKNKINRDTMNSSKYQEDASNKSIKYKHSNEEINFENKSNSKLSKIHIFKNKNIIKKINYNDYELNSLNYNEAIKIDKRTYKEFYMSFLRTKHLFIFTFITKNDYNSFIIKICLFFFGFALYLTVNVLFFNDSTMHKIYEDNGKFNFIYQIPQILYSTIISSLINYIIRYFSLSEQSVIKIKNQKSDLKEEIPKILKCLKIKFLFFFILSFIFMFLFWFYLSCFCSVYINTQRHIINDTLISFGLTLLYPFLLNLIPGILRMISLNGSNKNRNCLYKISQII